MADTPSGLLQNAAVVAVVFLIANPPDPPPQYFTEDGQPLNVKYETETRTIRLVP
jgi:hypothetical protein